MTINYSMIQSHVSFLIFDISNTYLLNGEFIRIYLILNMAKKIMTTKPHKDTIFNISRTVFRVRSSQLTVIVGLDN